MATLKPTFLLLVCWTGIDPIMLFRVFHLNDSTYLLEAGWGFTNTEFVYRTVTPPLDCFGLTTSSFARYGDVFCGLFKHFALVTISI